MPTRSTAAAASALVLGISLGFGAGAVGQDDACAPAIDAALRQHGLSLAEIIEPSFVVHRWQDDPNMAEDDRPISGYGFYGRPAVCSTGSIAIDLWENCDISDIRTRGGCHIEGIRHGWL